MKFKGMRVKLERKRVKLKEERVKLAKERRKLNGFPFRLLLASSPYFGSL